jgi:leucyl-tRNA synthetase
MTDFKLIESKWQEYWGEHPEIYNSNGPITNNQDTNNKQLPITNNQTKKKIYVLNEFPYPSGSGLHVGHAFSFIGGDVYARFKRMQGYNVLFPMGWDAFGLPTENYAIKMKRKPQDITRENTDMFRKQMKRLALSYDWDREINTTDPAYYKWTQWIFIQLFKKGLVYKKEMPINWCRSCKIGLANEEVIDGKCERCGSEVSRRNISQWVVKITEYADKLIDGLKETNFIDKVKQSQINWIGKSEGAHIKFSIFNFQFLKDKKNYLEVFTTRPDTLFGVTFMVIAPEHELVKKLISEVTISKTKKEEIENYIKVSQKKSDMERVEISKEKTGVFSGLYVINPVNNKQIPIWISDFVLANYGTGAIMSVPAHDDQDKDFAKKFGLEIIDVYNEEEKKVINSEFLNGLTKEEAGQKIIKWLEEKYIGERTASYHLRDWIFSRQHYWGEPIPMIFCKNCAKNQNNQETNSKKQNESFNEIQDKLKNYVKKTGIDIRVLENNPGWFPVEEKQLPIVLPEVEAYEPTDDGKSPLSKIEGFIKCKCPVCDKEAIRETDTMPNWAGSDWYYLAYCMATKVNNQLPITKKQTITNNQDTNNIENKLNDVFVDIFSDSKKELEYWGPVDVYIGGDEHNVLHLLYSRFIYQFLWDLGVLPKKNKEPYYKRISHGVILGPDGQRMSKSKGNVIVPEVVADKYGVDVVRMYLMFMGPFDSTMAWNENTLMGVKRFLDKFIKFINNQETNFNKQSKINIASNKEVKLIINKLIKSVSEDLENFKYNTAIAKLMEAINSLSAIQSVGLSEEDIKTLVKLIAPMAPYTAEEMWSQVNEKNGPVSVHLSDWPEVDKKYLVEETVVIAVAVDGKVRGQLIINNVELIISNKDTVINKAKDLEQIKKWIGEGKIVKEIYVPGKMVNIVLR